MEQGLGWELGLETETEEPGTEDCRAGTRLEHGAWKQTDLRTELVEHWSPTETQGLEPVPWKPWTQNLGDPGFWGVGAWNLETWNLGPRPENLNWSPKTWKDLEHRLRAQTAGLGWGA
jgi:hypothetical protein